MRNLNPDLICLSHLRWGFVYQRPQHLLSRFAKRQRVFFFEEPVLSGGQTRLDMRVDDASNVMVAIPHLPDGLDDLEAEQTLAKLLDQMIRDHQIERHLLWYYTPMALGFSEHLSPSLVIYDCMDELSAFQGASPLLRAREAQLFRKAHLVFTGGRTLYEAKRSQHPDVHAFPSSVDVKHFAQARTAQPDPADQAKIPHPRIGYCGVIDERMDIELLGRAAALRPDWHFIMIGPVAKIDAETLPQRSNIHYLGPKSYAELPKYMAGWDAAMLPFARNESTKFISPTKTPEYLAAGLPSVSTSIRDVVHPYRDLNLVEIADTPEDFVSALDRAMSGDRSDWLSRASQFLSTNSWDSTWAAMCDLIAAKMDTNVRNEVAYV
ncbi:MAG: glycosyltransferase family 1 protein [Acidobacteriaceae bacterium]|nr:glycosyltransferase family 1 protein [Acidobacteriaceae bacterium]